MDTITQEAEVVVDPVEPQQSHELVTPGAPAPLPAPAETGSVALMRMIERGVMDPTFDVAKLEKLLAVKKDWERDEARKAFVAAKAAFRAEAPTVGKDKHVGFDAKDDGSGSRGKVEYDHATLGNVAATISPILGRHGLAYSWETKQLDGGIIEVTCVLTHALGHSERVTLRAGADNSGKKNAIQQMGSTVTYLQRYTLLAITGTATADQDDDGLSAEATMMIDEDQKEELVELLKLPGQNTKAFLEYLGIESLDRLPAARFPAAKKALREKAAAYAAKQQSKSRGNGEADDGFPGDRPSQPDARARIKGDHR